MQLYFLRRKVLNKKELIQKLADTTGASKTDITKVLDTLPLVLGQELLATGRVTVPGIAIAKIKDRPARQGRNPKTGEIVQIAAKKVVTIKTLKGFGL